LDDANVCQRLDQALWEMAVLFHATSCERAMIRTPSEHLDLVNRAS
jgi:hypothetical protein